MPISIIITGILTGTVAAAFALSLDSGAMWAFVSYSLSGALALFGAGLVTTIRRNAWPRKSWYARLDQMVGQSDCTNHIGVFTAVKRDRQVRM